MDIKELACSVERWANDHKEEMVRDIIKIVNQKSVSDPGEGGYAFGTDCKKCGDVMAGMGQDQGFVIDNDDYYTLSLVMPGKTDREIGILGHLDVVPAGAGWHYEPYNAIEKDGVVIGRGSSDNKGAVIMSMYVMKYLREMGISLNHTLRLICGFNEESGMKDVEHYLTTHKAPEFTIVCDGGWAMCIGEKGTLTADLVQKAAAGNLVSMKGGTVTNAVSGYAEMVISHVDGEKVKRQAAEFSSDLEVVLVPEGTKIMAKGKAAHAAFPDTGDSAIYKLCHFADQYGLLTEEAREAVKNLSQTFVDEYGTGLGIAFEDSISGKTTCVGGVISFEQGELIQNINVRYAINQDSEELMDRLNQVCGERNMEVRNLDYSRPRYSDPKDPVIKMLLDTCHEFLGQDYEAYTMGGGTHARKFPNALPYGPGSVKLEHPNPFGHPHGIDEAVSLEGLIRSMSVYVAAITRLDEML